MVGIRFAWLRVMKRILIIILFFLFLSEISFAEIFKWVDEKGVVHFTDDILQVPEKYRSKTKKMELPEGIEGTNPIFLKDVLFTPFLILKILQFVARVKK